MLDWIGPIKNAFDLLEKIFKYAQGLSAPRRKVPEHYLEGPGSSAALAKRFIELFTAHGVLVTQIPKFFGHGLALADLRNERSLLGVLSEEKLADAAELFAVRREWLDGESDQIYPCKDFYKNPAGFARWLAELQESGAQLGNAVVIRGTRSGIAGDRDDENILILIEEYIGSVGDRSIYKNHVLANLGLGYWKSRADVAAIVACAWKRECYMRGRKIQANALRGYLRGEKFVGKLSDSANDTWYPEDLALNPEDFVENLSPVDAALGLDRWLEWAEIGLMDAGIRDFSEVQCAFESARAALGKRETYFG